MVYAKFSAKRPPYMALWFFKNHQIWCLNKIGESPERYKFANRYCEGKNVLDAACGIGYGSSHLVNHGVKSVHAIDLSEETIAFAKQKFTQPNLTFQVDNCETLSTVNTTYDAIVAMECIEHFLHPENFLARCTQVMNDQGLLLVSTPNVAAVGRPSKNGKPVNTYHIREYTYSEFFDLLRLYFRDVAIYYQVKSRNYLLYEDTVRFVNFAYKVNPFLKLALLFRRLFKHPGFDPIIRPMIPSESDFDILPELNDVNDISCFVYIAVCKEPIRDQKA